MRSLTNRPWQVEKNSVHYHPWKMTYLFNVLFILYFIFPPYQTTCESKQPHATSSQLAHETASHHEVSQNDIEEKQIKVVAQNQTHRMENSDQYISECLFHTVWIGGVVDGIRVKLLAHQTIVLNRLLGDPINQDVLCDSIRFILWTDKKQEIDRKYSKIIDHFQLHDKLEFRQAHVHEWMRDFGLNSSISAVDLWKEEGEPSGQFPVSAPVFISDFVRVYVLWKYGGIYHDFDMAIVVMNDDKWCTRKHRVRLPSFSGATMSARMIWSNSYFASRKRSRFLEFMLNVSIRAQDEQFRQSVRRLWTWAHLCGPCVWTNTIHEYKRKYLQETKRDIFIFQPLVPLPLPGDGNDSGLSCCYIHVMDQRRRFTRLDGPCEPSWKDIYAVSKFDKDQYIRDTNGGGGGQSLSLLKPTYDLLKKETPELLEYLF